MKRKDLNKQSQQADIGIPCDNYIQSCATILNISTALVETQ